MTSDKYQIKEKDFCVEILDDGISMHYSTIVNRLNEQHEEKEFWKQQVEQYSNVLEVYKHQKKAKYEMD
jgi:hypothetical protein